MHPETIQIKNLDLAWYEGRSDGTPVILLHGNSLSSEIFSEQFADPLLADHYRLIALDLPGHGQSAHSDNPLKDYSLQGLINHFLNFMEKMEIEKAVFAGHSLGGHIIMEAYPKLKDRMLGMVIFGAPPFTMPPQMEKTHLDHPAQYLVYKEDLTEEEIHTLAHACVRESHEDPELLMEAIRHSDPDMRAGLGLSYSKGEIQDEARILSEMEHPLAIFHGSEDQLINGEYFRELKLPTLWQNTVQVLDQAGHCPQFETPEAFDTLLNDFINELANH
ncbi:MAG: alpha/beta hydrolase [Bacteroidales bacterium]|nr:alpha/beta hydrolase [Bacteroidales bacterium]